MKAWTTTEIATLKQWYPLEGSKCSQRLPRRTQSAIAGKAALLRIAGPKHIPEPGASRGYRMWKDSDATDAIIRKGYESARPDYAAMRLETGFPEWKVKKRAQELGCAMPLRAERWTEAEDEIVRECACRPVAFIRGRLKAAGFERTLTAVAVRLKRLDGIDRTDPDIFTAHGAAEILGVDATTVGRWVRVLGLKAKRRPWGHTDRLEIKRQDLRTWIRDNPDRIDLRKVDRELFIHLAFGETA